MHGLDARLFALANASRAFFILELTVLSATANISSYNTFSFEALERIHSQGSAVLLWSIWALCRSAFVNCSS